MANSAKDIGLIICYFLCSGFNILSINANVEEPLPENFTLVYDHHVGYKLFCKFGTDKEIGDAKRYIAKECFENYKGMKIIGPNGETYRPYLSFDSIHGFSLQCEGEIPNVSSMECKDKPPYIGAVCAYNCSAGYSVTGTNVTCRLMKPLQNVTAKWWPSNPCQPVEISGNFSEPMIYPTENASQPNILMIILIVGLCVFVVIAACIVTYPLYKWKTGRGRTIHISNQAEGFGELPSQIVDTPNCWTGSSDITAVNNNKVISDKFLNEYQVCLEDEKNDDIKKEESVPEQKITQLHIKKDDDYIQDDDFESEISKLLRTDTDIVNNLKYVEQPRLLQKCFATPLLSETLQGTESEYKERCSENVNVLFKEQSLKYRAKLRGELEFIEGRSLEKTLAGFVRENWKKMNFASENEVKVIEHSYSQRTDEKVSDYFLQIMSHHGITVSEILQYFTDVEAYDVVNVVLEVHHDCSYCDKFRR